MELLKREIIAFTKSNCINKINNDALRQKAEIIILDGTRCSFMLFLLLLRMITSELSLFITIITNDLGRYLNNIALY